MKSLGILPEEIANVESGPGVAVNLELPEGGSDEFCFFVL